MHGAERFLLFDGFRIDRHGRSVYAPDGVPVALTGRAFDVLVYLADHADRVVRKDELLSQIWPGRVVEENNLAQAVAAVRRALRPAGAERDFIVTVAGRGYRFTANVAPVADPGTNP
jgi:DNA-binding winged helix-turn-helix (wHTH) protein